MYTKKEDDFECKCGLRFDEIEFADFRCIICFEDDFEIICTICGIKGNQETFTNFMCASCFVGWCAQ